MGKTKAPTGPLVIPSKPNPEWREAARRRRAGVARFIPDSAKASTDADGSIGGRHYADDTESVDDFTLPGSSGEGPVDPESNERAMRLIVRLEQPFSAFLLAQQRSGEYKRIASDRDIITQVRDVDSVHSIDIRTLEIL
ncbi:hypothetical protein BDR05DRAFT_122304 [Suillus weaverae]|nr:hypothetical protein BDR05DRAFT_122304 [Suillus weaverae]